MMSGNSPDIIQLSDSESDIEKNNVVTEEKKTSTGPKEKTTKSKTTASNKRSKTAESAKKDISDKGNKRRKTDFENRQFNEEWTEKFLFVEFNNQNVVNRQLLLQKNTTLQDIMKQPMLLHLVICWELQEKLKLKN